MYIKYDVQTSDTFHESRYGRVSSELTSLARGTANIESQHKSAIIISYLKDHSICIDRLKENAQLTRAITSGRIGQIISKHSLMDAGTTRRLCTALRPISRRK